jgi:hypothetical protein
LQSPKPIRSEGQASAYEDHLHHYGMIPSPVTAATVVTPGPGSDSGLSGLDQTDTKRVTRSTTPKTASQTQSYLTLCLIGFLFVGTALLPI